MKFDELVKERLINNQFLQENLARYAGNPAVFYQEAPDSKAKGWSDSQYPRIDFMVDMQTEQGRYVTGITTITVWSDDKHIDPEDIEPYIKEEFRDLFITPDNGIPMCLSWKRSDSFDNEKESVSTMKKAYGIDIVFDIMEFPNHKTFHPDPVQTLGEHLKSFPVLCRLIGKDNMDVFYRASSDEPALYIRAGQMSNENKMETYSVAWMTTKLHLHIFAPSNEDRLCWVRYYTDMLSTCSEITMPDNSPMFIKDVQADNYVDYLSDGQVTIGVTFGILKNQDYEHRRMQPRFRTGGNNGNKQ